MVISSCGRGAVARPPLLLGASDSFTKAAIMKCDVCSQEVGNSEELQKHKELTHPAGADNLEKPDLLGDTSDESGAIEVAQPTH
jgi:hypothetical protein